MPQDRLMTQKEEADILLKAHELRKQGKLEEAERITKQAPLQPYLAKFVKDHFGADFLLNLGWNLAEANAEYGSDWLNK